MSKLMMNNQSYNLNTLASDISHNQEKRKHKRKIQSQEISPQYKGKTILTQKRTQI
jgi:hypothetical protein